MDRDIYDEHDQRTGNISAYAILSGSEYVARVTFINGAACSCYLQVWGAPMVKGQARGGNYDRHSAAIEMAAAKIEPIEDKPAAEVIRARIASVINDPKRDGEHWDRRLRDAGFDPYQVI